MLLYADAIAVIGRSPDDLQCMLDTLNLQCKHWRVIISTDKAKCIHFWTTRSKLSNFEFTVGSNSIYVSYLHIKVISQKCRKPFKSFKSTNFKKNYIYYTYQKKILDSTPMKNCITHASLLFWTMQAVSGGTKNICQSIDIIQYGLFGISWRFIILHNYQQFMETLDGIQNQY